MYARHNVNIQNIFNLDYSQQEKNMHCASEINNEYNICLHRWGAMALFIMPLCYVCMFMIFGVMLSIPQTEILNDKIAYLAANQGIISVAYISGYLFFGCMLLIAVQAIHHSLAKTSSHLLQSASAFGLIWVVLMMCSGMIALVGMDTMINVYYKDPQNAQTLFFAYTIIVDALGGGIELVGGLWVFLLSICGLSHQQLSKSLSLFGIMVGLLGILTVYQAIPEFKDAFGLTQVVWFVWVGITLLAKTQRQMKVSSS